ncbi:hypothetical protein BFP70_13265 [Thioclava sp. SK-1]|uniref:hypothetical protein n=1 Tax=Thioclava sp. SK-1 TaxID=1889770 RepID=UPI0008241E94|nr:hypothetical protein [Thioclava sp. SK-1]OCX63167.1 hypothetical protein BFP70_13265 [Thioclava sp. SK-1]
MTKSDDNKELLPKVEQLIDLLTRVLSRDAHPLADRMDEFLQELTRIDRSMSEAATTLTTLAPQLAGMATQADVAGSEDRMTNILEDMAKRQYRIEVLMAELFQPLGQGDSG